MEVLVGPALPAHVRARSAQDSGGVVESGVKGNNRVSSAGSEEDNKIGFYFGADGSDSSSSDSSSIGVQSDDEDTNGVVSDKDGDVEEDEVQSKPSGVGLGSLDALEDSLPVKRGLSNYFAGKSKSFGNLSEVSTVKDLKKEENPLNKRRRTLLAMRMNKKSFYSWARNQPTSMPLLALAEEEEEEEEQSSYEDQQEEEEEKHKYGQFRHSKMFSIRGPERKFRSFQSTSCSCLTDLQEEDDDYEEEQSSYEDQLEEEVEKHKYGQFRHSKMFSIRGQERKFRSFQSPSCSCLTDLQEEDDDYEEE